MAKPPCLEVTGHTDVCTFFDALAQNYREAHGDPQALLRYRLRVIDRLLEGRYGGSLLEIGCGPADHLFALAPRFDRCLGVDLSPKMIEVAENKRRIHPCAPRIGFRVAPAETLEGVSDTSQDAVLMVGVLEHLLDQAAALKQVGRVLKPGGKLVCLTPDAAFLWYRIASRLGWPCRYLSSDRFLTASQIKALVESAGLKLEELTCWRFVPEGAMPVWAAALFGAASHLGKALKLSALAGGLGFRAGRPKDPVGG